MKRRRGKLSIGVLFLQDNAAANKLLIVMHAIRKQTPY